MSTFAVRHGGCQRALLLAALAVLGPPAGAAGTTYAELAPILAERCVMCHSGPNAPRGLRLDSLGALLAGAATGPVVRAGNPAASELIRRLKGESAPRMPMTGPPFLSDAEIARFEAWIAAGMPPGNSGGDGPVEAPPSSRPAPGQPVTYAHVAPIFATRCAKCHTDNGLMGPAPEQLRLTSYAATLDTGERARVVPGEPAASELLRRIRGDARPRMPFDGPPYLSADEQALIDAWIAQGARDAQGVAAARPIGARVRLHGALTARWALDGMPLSVGGARIDKNPHPGDYVEVRGRVAPGRGVEVDRLRRR